MVLGLETAPRQRPYVVIHVAIVNPLRTLICLSTSSKIFKKQNQIKTLL